MLCYVSFLLLEYLWLFIGLSDADIGQLWLPLVIYDNTDQKESTRLGENWEWVTRVSVVKEGKFTRSGLGEVDEAEIFKGVENTLTMTQTYTWEFQCQYKLQHYPFDTQVNMIQNSVSTIPLTQECAIKMTVESQSNETVELLANEVCHMYINTDHPHTNRSKAIK